MEPRAPSVSESSDHHPEAGATRSRAARILSRARFTSPALLAAVIVPLTALGAFTVVKAQFASASASGLQATLTVDSRPSGAEVEIDGRASGVTPMTIAVAPGAHTATLRATGAERTWRVEVAPGTHVVHYLELQPDTPATATGRLSIVTEPPGARVVVDGSPRGVSPLAIDVAAAKHTVVVTNDSGSAERVVAVEPGIAKEVVFALRSTAKVPAAGWVTVTSPFPVELVKGSQIVGTAAAGTSARIMLEAGRHHVVLRNEELAYESSRQIDVAAGAVTSIEVTPPTATVSVNARPWAEVMIDDKSVGQTPLANLVVPIGTHQFTFRHPELGERKQTVVVAATTTNRVSVDLTKAPAGARQP
jgi:hypothetical protein